MKIHKIKSEKQYNGLWGLPMNLYNIDFICGYPKDDLNLLVSAIIIKFDEIFNISFKCSIGNTEMTILTDNNFYRLPYKDYKIVDDKLYYLESDDDKKMFLRNQKLNKLKNKIFNQNNFVSL
jgi:hypothetical protein